MAKARFPFLLYGDQPDNWIHGPQLYLVRFLAPPSLELRRQLGDEAAAALDQCGVAIDAEFGESWAAFFAEETGAAWSGPLP